MYWIETPRPGNLAIAPRPRAGDWLNDEVAAWRSASVDTLVSLLEMHEVHELGLQAEPEVCALSAIEFVSFPIVDRGVPTSLTKTRELVSDLGHRLSKGRNVLVHCRAGIGRSALVTACVLVSLGLSPDSAFEHIATARGLIVPDTQVQRDWVEAFTPF